jgi:Ca2+-binding RTX toxin-like protein
MALIKLTGNVSTKAFIGTNLSDTIVATAGADILNGKAGNDTLIGGLGNDFYDFSAGFGIDTVVEATVGGTDTVRILSDIPGSAVRLVGDVYDDLRIVVDGYGSIRLADHLLDAKVEFLKIGSAAPISLTAGLTMTGSVAAESIYGTRFADKINSGAGNDSLFGGAGNDRLNGGIGADIMSGGLGNDTYIVDNIGDVVADLSVSGGIDTVESNISYALGANIENLALTTAATIGTGNTLNNIIVGNNANNILSGLSGNDTLIGGAGNDRLTGGTGLDHFVFADNCGSDTITDFSKVQLDRLDFSQIDANVAIAGDQGFTFMGTSAFTAVGAQIRFSTLGSNTIVELNTDVDLAAEYQIQLIGPVSLSALDCIV